MITATTLTQYALAVGKWTLAGAPTRSDDDVAAILAICRACEAYDAELERCSHCGCRVTGSEHGIANKARMATESCPRGHWGPIVDDPQSCASILSRWNAADKPTRSPDDVATIYATQCELCAKLIDGVCLYVQCRTFAHKRTFRNMIRFATESCPEGKW